MHSSAFVKFNIMTIRVSPHAQASGFIPERLALIAPYLQKTYIDTGRLPCAQFLVARGGEVAYECSIGYMGIEDKQPLLDDALFRIYSMTKPLTSVAFMMLVEEGRVALDEPVAKYIPEFAKLGVYVSGELGNFQTRAVDRPMIILDLLRHTSGFTYGFQARTAVDAAYRELDVGGVNRNGSLETMIEKLATLPLEFSPGSAWNYSVSTDVLGYLVGKISGQSFESFLQERLLNPLGMVDTHFQLPESKIARFTHCYAATTEGGMKLVDAAAKSAFLAPAEMVSGGGGLISTTKDYFQFCKMMNQGGHLNGKHYLGRKTIELMQSNHLPGGKDLPELSISMFSESVFNGVGFGLGFSVVNDPAKTMIAGSVGESAWGGMASTAFWLDPKEDLFAIFMTQLMPSSTYPVRRQLRTMVYSALA
jgi:CubicO group peptidase (beta-lactamase class C family)